MNTVLSLTVTLGEGGEQGQILTGNHSKKIKGFKTLERHRVGKYYKKTTNYIVELHSMCPIDKIILI